jgi:hypothetical protein
MQMPRAGQAQPGAAGRGRLCSGGAAARCQQVDRGFHIALMSSMVTVEQAAADDWSVLGASTTLAHTGTLFRHDAVLCS